MRSRSEIIAAIAALTLLPLSASANPPLIPLPASTPLVPAYAVSLPLFQTLPAYTPHTALPPPALVPPHNPLLQPPPVSDAVLAQQLSAYQADLLNQIGLEWPKIAQSDLAMVLNGSTFDTPTGTWIHPKDSTKLHIRGFIAFGPDGLTVFNPSKIKLGKFQKMHPEKLRALLSSYSSLTPLSNNLRNPYAPLLTYNRLVAALRLSIPGNRFFLTTNTNQPTPPR